MPSLEVEIVNKVTNMSALAEEKAALSGALGGGFTPLGGGTVNFGGSLSREEQAVAAAQMSLLAGNTKAAGAAAKEAEAGFKGYENQLKQAVIVSGEAGSITDGLARKMNAFGQLGLTPMSVGLIGGVVGLGMLVEAGKSWISNADKQEAATRSLAQGYAVLNEKIPTKAIDEFIDRNKGSIKSMYEAEEGFAALARAGFNDSMQMRLMNDAVDLAVIKHIDLATAVAVLIKAHGGQTRALLDLGITLKQIDDPMKDFATATQAATRADEEKGRADRALQEEVQKLHDKHKVTKEDLMHLEDLKYKDALATKKDQEAHQNLAEAQAYLNAKGERFQEILAQLEPKIQGGRNSLSESTQASDKLSIAWQKLSNQDGPGLQAKITDIKNAAADMTDQFLAFGSNDQWWGNLNKGLTEVAANLRPIVEGIKWINANTGIVSGMPSFSPIPGGININSPALNRLRGFITGL